MIQAKNKRLLVFLFSFLLFCTQAISQPFYTDIQAFKKQDSLAMPPANQILFVGSSSFTNWKDVQDYFPSHPIINRGFGGSSLTDVIRYADDVIFRYEPKQIVIYCGENDIAGTDSVTGKMVFERFQTLFEKIRSRMLEVAIAYISMKPSPSRWQMKERVIEGNERIKKFLKKQKHTKFVSVWKAMLDSNDQPRKDLFVADMLHMSAQGYAIWKEKIERHLIK